MSSSKKNRTRLRVDAEFSHLKSQLSLARFNAAVNRSALEAVALKWETPITEDEFDAALAAFEKAVTEGHAVAVSAARAAVRNLAIGNRCTFPHQTTLVHRIMGSATLVPEGLVVNELQMRQLVASLVDPALASFV